MHTWWNSTDTFDDAQIRSGRWFPDDSSFTVGRPHIVQWPDAQWWYTHIYHVQIEGYMHDVSVRYKNYQNDPAKIHVQVRYMSGWQIDEDTDVTGSRSLREFAVLKRDFKPKIHTVLTEVLDDMSGSLGVFLGQIAHTSFDVQQRVKDQIELICQDVHGV